MRLNSDRIGNHPRFPWIPWPVTLDRLYSIGLSVQIQWFLVCEWKLLRLARCYENVCKHRSVGGSQLVHSGDDLIGALLRHLSSSAVKTLADTVSLLQDVGCCVGVRLRRHDSNRCQSEIPTARQRSSQMFRGVTLLLSSKVVVVIRIVWTLGFGFEIRSGCLLYTSPSPRD